MRNIRKAIYKFLLVVFFVVALQSGARLCYENWVNQTVQSKMEREKLKGTIDTLYCGNSLTYYAFSPQVLDEVLGWSSFNLATASQPYIGTYYLIRDAVEDNPIEQIYVTVALPPLKEQAGTRHYVSGFENMCNWKWKLRYLWAVQKEDVWVSSLLYTTQIEDYLDLKGVKSNLRGKLVTKATPSNYAGRGYRYTEDVFEGRENEQNGRVNSWSAESEEQQVQEEALRYLEKIAVFCEERGIRLTFVTMPYTQAYLDGAKDLDAFHEYIAGKAEEWGADFWNFMLYKDREHIFTDDKFKDDHHMNAKGSEAFCSIFAQVVQSEQPKDYFYERMEEFDGND